MTTIGASGWSRLVLGCLLAIPIIGLSSQESRITGAIDGNRAVALKRNIQPRALAANDRGALDPLTPIPYMRMALKPTVQQAADLEQLLEAQRDPTSSDYHRWLTPEEYGERFGVNQDDIDQIRAWLESQGFAVEQVARARNWIAFSGAAGQVGKTFRTELHRYQADGETHFANATAPSIPEALAGIVGELHGLDDFHPRPPRTKKIVPDLTTTGGAHYLAPDDLATIYDISALYKAGYDGTGQKLVIAGQTDINLADIRGFRSTFGLTAKDPQLVLYGPDPGVSPDDQLESDLDLEWSGAVARNATIIFVYSQDVFESVQYAIDQNLAPVISLSYGGCELGVSASSRALVQQANAEGITWMNSSGDSGAAGCDWGGPLTAQYGPAVSYPADIPEITAVGGAEFNESGSAGWSTQNSATMGSATGYLPEKAWNDTALGGGIWASGGGASVVFPKPWWQAGQGVPSDNARDVPDISLTASGAHDGYLIYLSGGVMSVGGTSASSPSFAGIVAIINQYVVAKGVQATPGLGNINPTLYSLAQNTTGIIHDITVGDNIVPCVNKSVGCTTGSFGYKAGAGYDLVTGLGSVDAYNLVTRWASLPVTIGTTMTLTASPASIVQSATTQLTAKITAVTGTNPPTGSVTFTAGGVSLGSAAAIVSGAASSASLTVKGSSLTAGSETITASYTATGSFSNSTASATVTVTGTPIATKTVVTVGAASVAATGTAQLTATVTPASGSVLPTGSVTFSVGTTALGTATLGAAAASNGAATAVLSVSASKLAAGANSITSSYAGSGSFASSVSAAITVTVAAPLIATTALLAASPVSIAQSASTVLTVTVTAASGSTAPTGSVSFSAGGTALGTAALAGSGGTVTATLTVKGSSLAAGSNPLTASYGGDGKFSGSTASVTVTTAVPPAATTTVAAASPPGIAQNAATTVTAMVKATTGAALPAGTVNFALGNTSLGSATLTATGGMAAAVLTVAGSKLNAGSNTITASYAASGSFAASTGSVIVVVTATTIATTTAVAASPASIAPSATTQLTATVKAASGSAAPAGSVTFSAGNVAMGSATLAGSGVTATAVLTVNGSNLAGGSNTVVASYGGNSTCSASTASVTVAVALPPVATTTVAAASPPTIAPSDTTTVTAMVKAASGTALPAGTVNFALGNTSLGSAPLTVMGGMTAAVLSVPGSKLSLGSNSIVASYAGSSSFAPSAGSVIVVVTASLAATTTVAAASPPTIAPSATTTVTAMVKAASGTALPAGTVSFALGSTSLGSATLTVTSGMAAAVLSVAGSKLRAGSNSITASYVAGSGFAASTGSVIVVVTPPAATTTVLTARLGQYHSKRADTVDGYGEGRKRRGGRKHGGKRKPSANRKRNLRCRECLARDGGTGYFRRNRNRKPDPEWQQPCGW